MKENEGHYYKKTPCICTYIYIYKVYYIYIKYIYIYKVGENRNKIDKLSINEKCSSMYIWTNFKKPHLSH